MLIGNKNAALLAMTVLACFSASAQADTRLIVLPGNISASAHDGNVPANTNDGNVNTRWSADASGKPQWIQYQLGGCYNITGVNLAWHKEKTQRYHYSVQTSVDGVSWAKQYEGLGGAGLAPARLAEVAANYLRIVSTGNGVDGSVGLDEVEIMSSGAARCPAVDTPVTADGGMSAMAVTADAVTAAAVTAPGQNFDLSRYTLQLPTGAQGSVDTVSASSLEAGYTKKPYFYSGSDGAMIMMDPRVGYTTSGSQHPRTELRENATWTTGGTNLLDANLAVTKVPGNTAIAQIFQGTGPSKPLCELQYSSSGAVKLFLEDTNQGGSGSTTTITTVPLGTRFTYQLKLSGKTITVKVNSTTKTFTMDDSFVGEKFYFKAGNYDQTATQGTPQTTDGTVVKFYTLKITH
jgi:hypothetical protein